MLYFDVSEEAADQVFAQQAGGVAALEDGTMLRAAPALAAGVNHMLFPLGGLQRGGQQ